MENFYCKVLYPKQTLFLTINFNSNSVTDLLILLISHVNQNDTVQPFFLCKTVIWQGVARSTFKNKVLPSVSYHELFIIPFKVGINAETSSFFFLNAGVPQGSVLGPFIYLLYTSDFPSLPNISIVIFADDIAVLFSDITTLHQINSRDI